MSPIAATSPAATVTFTPAIVSRRRTAGSSTVASAISRSSTARSSPRRSSSRRCRVDRRALVVGQDLTCEPGPARPVEQLGVRARRDQMRGQDRMDLVLHPGAVPDDLVAPRHQAAPALGLGIGQPDLGQEAGRMQRRQDTGVDLVGLDVGVGDRLHLQRIGHDHAGHVGAEHAHHRHRVAGRLEHDLVVLGQAAAEALEPRAGHVDPTVPPQPPVLPEHHLGERPMDVHTDHAPHPIPSSSWPRERWAARQLRIRARSATGRVAGAASY